jgi:hypothetical protein
LSDTEPLWFALRIRSLADSAFSEEPVSAAAAGRGDTPAFAPLAAATGSGQLSDQRLIKSALDGADHA